MRSLRKKEEAQKAVKYLPSSSRNSQCALISTPLWKGTVVDSGVAITVSKFCLIAVNAANQGPIKKGRSKIKRRSVSIANASIFPGIGKVNKRKMQINLCSSFQLRGCDPLFRGVSRKNSLIFSTKRNKLHASQPNVSTSGLLLYSLTLFLSVFFLLHLNL